MSTATINANGSAIESAERLIEAAMAGEVIETTLAAAQKVADVIVIDRLAIETILVPIVGTSPLIVNRFGEKAKRQMLDAMQGRKSPKVAKDPDAEYESARYRFADGGDGIPSLGFWQATIGAARYYGGVTMTALKQFILPFPGEPGTDGTVLVRLIHAEDEPHMREDVVRVGRGGTDLRYRPEYPEWRTVLTVPFISSCITRDSVLSLIQAGGMGVGVCEWRPEKSGPYGTYTIDPDRQVEALR